MRRRPGVVSGPPVHSSTDRALRVKLHQTAVIPFAVVRVPLYLLDQHLVRRLPADSSARAAFDRGLGTVDLWAGRLRDVPAISARGLSRLTDARALAAPPHRATRRASPNRRYAVTRPATS